MNKLIVFVAFVLLALFNNAFAQRSSDITIKNIFTESDSVQLKSGDSFFWLYSDSSADTITSSNFRIENTGGDITIVGKVVNISGTTNTTVQLGRYFGPEYGYDWSDMATLTSTGTFKFNFVSQSWGDSEIPLAYAIRILRSGAQRNKYAIRVIYYKRN